MALRRKINKSNGEPSVYVMYESPDSTSSITLHSRLSLIPEMRKRQAAEAFRIFKATRPFSRAYPLEKLQTEADREFHERYQPFLEEKVTEFCKKRRLDFQRIPRPS